MPINTTKISDEMLIAKMRSVSSATQDKMDKLSEFHPEASPDWHAPTPQAGVLRTAGDVGIKVAQGVVGLGQAAVGLGSLATGGLVGKGMEAIGYNPEQLKSTMGDYLSGSQKEADAKVSAADGFVATLKESLANPRSILGSVAESAPGMLAGMGVTGAVARAIGAKAALAATEGLAASGMEAAAVKAVGDKAAQAAIEAASNRLMVVGAGTEGAQTSGNIAEQAQHAGREFTEYALPSVAAGLATAGIGMVSNKIFGDAATDIATGTKTLKGTKLAKLGKEAFSEGVTEELPQSAQEQVFTNMAMGEDDLTKGVGNAAASGLVAGAAMGVGMGSLHKSDNTIRTQAAKAEQVAASKETFAKAADSNDITAFIDPKSKSYDLSKGMGALLGHVMKPDTPEETKQANLKQAGELLAKLEKQHAQAKSLADDVSPETVKMFKDTLSTVTEQLKTAGPADAPLLRERQADLQILVKENTDPKRVTEANDTFSKLDRQLTAARAMMGGMVNKTQVAATPEHVSTLVDQIEGKVVPTPAAEATPAVDAAGVVIPAAPAAPVRTPAEAADQLINLSMSQPNAVSPAQAAQLANNMSNGLTAPQRDHLRTLSEARQAQNKLVRTDDVKNEVMFGDKKKGNVGISEYQERISAAIAAGNEESAKGQLADLTTFAKQHAQKLEMVKTALDSVRAKGGERQVVRAKDGTWAIHPNGYLEPKKLSANGGLQIHINSNKKGLVTNISDEVAALNATAAELKSATALKFGVQSGSPATQAVPPGNINTPTNEEDAARPAVPAELPAASTPRERIAKFIKEQADAKKAPPAPAKPVAAKPPAERSDAPVAAAATADAAADNQVVPPADVTPAQTTSAEDKAMAKALKEANRAYRKVARSNPESLWNVVKRALTASDLSDIYGNEWKKRYTMLKGTPGVSLSTLVADGKLDAFLPGDMQFGAGSEADEQDAVEYIKEALRNKEYLTYETQMAMQQVGLSIQDLEQYFNSGTIENETNLAEQAIEAGSAGQVPAAASQGTPGNTRTPGRQEGPEVTKPVAPVAATPSSTPASLAVADAPAATASSSADAAVNPEEEDAPAEPTGLSVFTQKVKKLVGSMQDVFLTLNPVAQFLKQDMHSEMFLTERPLVGVKDFLTAWGKNDDLPTQFVQDGENLTPAQHYALANMKEHLQYWNSILPANFLEYTGDAEYKNRDMMQHLYEKDEQGEYLRDAQGNLVVEENVKTAISAAMYQFVLSNANAPARMTPDQINSMHGQQKDTPIQAKGMPVLQTLTAFEDAAIHELGTAVVGALGLRAAGKNTPQDILPKLINAFGTHALMALVKDGYVTRVAIPTSEINNYFGEKFLEQDDATGGEVVTPAPSLVKQSFIQFVRNDDAKRTLTPEAKSIKDANTKVKSINEKLFGVDRAPMLASTKPATFVQKFAKNSQQTITKLQAKAVEAAQQTPHTLIDDMYKLTGFLGEEATLEIAGTLDAKSGKYHVNNQPAIEAQNDNLKSQWDLMHEMLDQASENLAEGETPQFYVLQSVWKNFRAGFTTQSLNQQTSKIHRYMFTRPNWETTMNMKDDAMVNEFLISVGMQLGVKTDAQPNEKTMGIFRKKLMGNPEIMQAVRAVMKHVINKSDTKITQAEINTIKDVATGAEGMASLQALIALAKYTEAKEKGTESIKFTLLVGADGKTSGPMLTHLALGAVDDIDDMYVLLNRGGFSSTAEGQPKHFGDFADKEGEHKGQDLYKDLSRHTITESVDRIRTQGDINKLRAKVNAMPEGKEKKMALQFVRGLFTQEQYNAVEAVTGELMDSDNQVTGAGRDLIKTPLTAFMFGSALKGSINSMADRFIENIDGVLEKMAQGKRKEGDPSLEEFLKSIDLLIGMGSTEDNKPASFSGQIMAVAPEARLTKALETSLNTAQIKALRKAFGKVIGAPASATMESYFGTLILRRNELNRTINGAYAVYEAAYIEARAQEMDRLMNAGEIAHRTKDKTKTGENRPLHDLTEEQDKALREKLKGLLPVMHSALSVQENDLAAGLFMGKSDNRVQDSQLYQNRVQVKEAVTYTTSNDRQANTNTITSQSTMRGSKEPGVAGTAYAIHSTDAMGMHAALAAYMEAQGLNVHDEISTGVHHIAKTAEAINKAIVEALLHYSPAREAINMLQRQAIEMARLIKSGALDNSSALRTLEGWTDLINKSLPIEEQIGVMEAANTMMIDSLENAYAADYMRLQAISIMAVSDQYTWEGGQFLVTEEIRDEAAKQLAALKAATAKATPEFAKAMKELNDHAEKRMAIENETYIAWLEKNTNTTREAVLKHEFPENSRLTSNAPVLMQTLETLQGRLPDELFTLLAKNNKLKGDKKLSVPEVINQLPKSERVSAMQQIAYAFSKIPARLASPFGERIDPNVAPLVDHNDAMVTAFEKNPVMDRATVLKTLRDALIAIPADTPNAKINNELFRELLKLVPADLVVRYVTPATSRFDLLGAPVGNSRGWYVADPVAGKAEVYILSTDHLHSAVTPEVVLHELTHAVLAQLIERAQREGSGPVFDLVQDLEALRAAAITQSKADGTYDTLYSNALKDVHELVSWGMSNAGFQDMLGKVKVVSKTKDNQFVTGLKAFFKAISNILFPGKAVNTNAEILTGMESLARNTAGLFAAVAAQPSRIEAAVNAPMAAGPQVQDYTSAQIYDALEQNNNGATVGAAHSAHLKGLLNTVVKSVFGPEGSFGPTMMKQTAHDPLSIYANAVTTGVAPFASETMGAGFAFTEQEAFVLEQVEATMRTALENKDGVMSIAYKELTKLYSEVRAKLSVESFYDGDWATANTTQRAEAQSLYDFVFKIKSDAAGKSDYMSRFAALALTHEGFRKQLGFYTSDAPAPTTMSFNERLNRIFNTVMSWVAGKMTETFRGQRADLKLNALVEQIVGIEGKKRAKLQAKQEDTLANRIGATAGDMTAGVKSAVEKFGKKDFFKKSGNAFVRLAGSGMSAVAGDRVDTMMEGYLKLRDKTMTGQLGLFPALLNEVRGATESTKIYQYLLRATKRLEGIRKDTITSISIAVANSFKDGGDYLTEAHNKALSAVVLRGDMQALYGTNPGQYTFDQLHDMVKDRSLVQVEIAAHEAQLTGPMRKFYQVSAEHLGSYLATGRLSVEHQLMNAGNIARVYGTGMNAQVSEASARLAEPIIDRLASLYALKYAEKNDITELQKVFATEASRATTDKGNGVEMILKTHIELQRESKDKLFAGSEALQMKGYLPEVYDPYMSVVMANDADGADLILRGYVPMEGYLGQDAAEAATGADRKRIYSLRDGGMKQWNSGIISTKDNRSKGNSVTNAGQQSAAAMATFAAEKRAGIQAMFNGTSPKPTKATSTFMAPVMNPSGDVTNYRYMMSNLVKDKLLNRDNRTGKLLGTMAGNTFDKMTAGDQNKRAIDALHAQYTAEFAEKPESYLTVGPRSTDPQLRELWRMLPRETKEYVQSKFGPNGMQVRNDVLDINFGYRKLSIGTSFDKEAAQRSFVEGMFVQIMEYGFAEKGQLRARQAEDIWQAIVKETKANLVVKSWSTMTGNLRSNWSQLFLMGVSPLAIVRGHRVAFKAAWEYKQDSAKLYSLQNQLKIGHLEPGMTKEKAEYQIKRLEDSLARNPVRPLIDAGLMPTIVEDVSVDEDIHSYKSRFTKKIDDAVDSVNPHILTGLQLLTMHHSTAPYKMMSYATQISDFLAKYTLYQHEMTKKNPSTHEQAVQLAAEAFINYDVPTHRLMQYANDSGLIMFSKYYIRIQKVLGRIYKDSPGRVMALMAFEHMVGDQPTVLDSGFMHHIGNPFNGGAISYFSSLDSVTSLSLVTGPFTTAVYNGQ